MPCTLSPSCFKQLSLLLCDLDTIVTSYVANGSIRLYLASIVVDLEEQASRTPNFIDPLPGPLVPYFDSEDDEEVQEIPKPPSSSARKRRRKMMKEPLDVAFLRRSSRLNKDQGLLDNAHADVVVGYPGVYTTQVEASSVIVPFLDVDTMQGIDGFIQIQPEGVSAAALLKLDAEADE
ncbi:hypothetical protein HU200_029382 [Digitaria exilis]|uniref:Uncharacterized protein n=1 Tax=Digitaria exilis TaxID=1010633 RepID=A0A835BUA3_9POAL|nr:hypothetical protein HU200_029382 [Digitaria exilis]